MWYQRRLESSQTGHSRHRSSRRSQPIVGCCVQGWWGPLWIEHKPTLCEGASIPLVVAEMYPLLRELVDDVTLVSEEDVKSAIRRLALRNKLVAEGAGAESLAAALTVPLEERGKTVCIISGGSIAAELLMTILAKDPNRAPR